LNEKVKAWATKAKRHSGAHLAILSPPRRVWISHQLDGVLWCHGRTRAVDGLDDSQPHRRFGLFFDAAPKRQCYEILGGELPLKHLESSMKNRNMISGLAVASMLALSVLGGCAHDEVKASKADDHNLALKPLPVREGASDEHNLAARAPAPAPVAAVAVPAVKAPAPQPAHDRCMPVALSSGAVGQPCLTTVAFITSLHLGAKQQAQALKLVKAADKSLAH
jgi:hypothetical protein